MNEPIGGGKVDHPLTDPSRVEGVVAAMWGDDSIAVAKDAFQWLESISAAAEFSLPARYAVIDRIDVSIKRHGQRLLEQYLALKPQSMFQERQLWKAAADIWKALGDAYTCASRRRAPTRRRPRHFALHCRRCSRAPCVRKRCRSSGY